MFQSSLLLEAHDGCFGECFTTILSSCLYPVKNGFLITFFVHSVSALSSRLANALTVVHTKFDDWTFALEMERYDFSDGVR